MNRQELKKYFDRKKEREDQRQILLHNKDFICIQKIIEQARTGDKLDIPKVINSLERFKDTTFALNENQKALYAEHCLIIGECVDALKLYVDELLPRQWTKWSLDHIPFVCARNCQNWVRLSREKGVYDFTYLGISALVLILSKIEKLYPLDRYPQRFHSFFAESSYPITEYHQTNQVKKLVACHVFEVQALRENITCDIKSIEALTEYKDTLNEKLIEDLLQVQADCGSVDERLKRLIIGKGNLQRLTQPKQNQNMPLSFDRAAENTKIVTKYYTENYQKSDDIEYKTIENLINSLTALYWGKLTYDVTKNF